MTDTTSSSTTAGTSVPRQSRRAANEVTGWVGWIVFAATMMVIIGGLHIFQGIVALFNDDYYLVGKNGLTVHIDYTAWGWTHLIAGVVIAAAGLGLYTGRMVARVIGVIVACLSLLINFAFIAAYPFWSTIVIAVDIFVIYALTVHGKEMKEI